MSERLTNLGVRNFRCLADLTVTPRSLNILFGPNGAGKSTFLDTLWFVRDCAKRGVDIASSERSHGIGALWDGADEGANISITIETDAVRYEVLFGYSSGRIEPFAGEKLYSKNRGLQLIDRKIGSDKASFYSRKLQDMVDVPLREFEKLAFVRFLDFDPENREALDLDRLLHFVNHYPSREFFLHRLRRRGSEMSHETRLWNTGENLWSVLRNLQGKHEIDNRYDTIMSFMRRTFPSFQGLVLYPTGPNSIYCEFRERSRERPIYASGVSDGHLQMLILLTALFSEGQDRGSLILFDEPDTSLHPHALAVLTEAMKLAANSWNKQIFVATHSPVFISQFNPEEILAVELSEEGQTQVRWVSEIDGVKDLLEEYAVGSLYMAEQIAAQSRSEVHSE